jgi:type IV secretory pathway TrbF-like protein
VDSESRRDSAWLTARTEFAGVYGDLARGKRNWQLMALALVTVLVIETVGYIRLSLTARVTPYVVEVDKLGLARALGPVEPLRRTDARLVVAQIAEFVRDVRTVVPSEAAESDVMARAYAFVDQGGAMFLNAYFTDPKNNPRVLARTITRTAQVTAVLPTGDGWEGWRVQWVETEYPVDGAPPVVHPWEAYVRVRLSPPVTTETIERNPLGVYVTSISWTQVGTPS